MELVGLNRQAELDLDLGEKIDWSLPVSTHLLWVPPHLSHMYHLKIYEELNAEVRLRYNQFFALLVIEQISAFEKDVLVHVDEQVFKHLKNQPETIESLKTALDHFVREEKNHVAFFEKLLSKSREALELPTGFSAFEVSKFQGKFLKFLFSFPRFFIFWIWIVLFVEERTLLIARLMTPRRATFDPLHFQVQHAHLRDERRHVQLDEHLLNLCWDPAPKWLKFINIQLLKIFLEVTFVKSMTAQKLWFKFADLYPAAANYNQQAFDELQTLPEKKSYIQQFFSKSSAPRFWKMLNARPEMHSVINYLQERMGQSKT